MDEDTSILDDTAREAVELANRWADRHPEADLWDIADGLLAGAVHYWLYSRQPCGDSGCEDCAPISTAELRLGELLRLVRESAEGSDYFHAPTDFNAGRA